MSKIGRYFLSPVFKGCLGEGTARLGFISFKPIFLVYFFSQFLRGVLDRPNVATCLLI